jgi:hypothetical protein
LPPVGDKGQNAVQTVALQYATPVVGSPAPTSSTWSAEGVVGLVAATWIHGKPVALTCGAVARLNVSSTSNAGMTPTPVRVTGEPVATTLVAPDVTARFPVMVPSAVGENTTLTVQEDGVATVPAARVAPQLVAGTPVVSREN